MDLKFVLSSLLGGEMMFGIKLIITIILFAACLLCYLLAGCVVVATLYIALTDPHFDRYARQIAVVIVLAIAAAIFGDLTDRMASS